MSTETHDQAASSSSKIPLKRSVGWLAEGRRASVQRRNLSKSQTAADLTEPVLKTSPYGEVIIDGLAYSKSLLPRPMEARSVSAKTDPKEEISRQKGLVKGSGGGETMGRK